MKPDWMMLGLLLLSLSACNSLAQITSEPAKALIELGWDAPTPDYLRANIKTMEQRPFDGLMVNLNAGKTIFNKTAYTESAFTKDQTDLAATSFGKLNQNFITIWSARETGWDWFNDQDWAATTTNARNFAKTAKAGNFKGFFFDPEPYGTNPWSYNTQLYPSQSFASVQAKVRQRGAAFLSAIQNEIPNVKIMTLLGVTYIKKQALDTGSLEKADWTLLVSFIDGMLDVINPQAQLIDGNEPSYYYTNAKDFSDFRAQKQTTREYVSLENRTKYDQQVKIAHAVFADWLLNFWKSPRFFPYYFQNDLERQQFIEHNTYQALQNSDQYVWVYNERMDWWGSKGSGVQLPIDLENSLKRATQKISQNQELGFGTEFVTQTVARYNAKVQVFGRIATKDGQGVGGVMLDAGFVLNGEDTACPNSLPDGYYGCTFPANWTGTITPKLLGYTFNPSVVTLKNLTQQIDEQNFEATKK